MTRVDDPYEPPHAAEVHPRTDNISVAEAVTTLRAFLDERTAAIARGMYG